MLLNGMSPSLVIDSAGGHIDIYTQKAWQELTSPKIVKSTSKTNILYDLEGWCAIPTA